MSLSTERISLLKFNSVKLNKFIILTDNIPSECMAFSLFSDNYMYKQIFLTNNLKNDMDFSVPVTKDLTVLKSHYLNILTKRIVEKNLCYTIF